jgi:hypothetical protein
VRLRPTTLKEANEFVSAHHRHHKPSVGHKFSIGLEYRGDTSEEWWELCGVVIAGRPVARALDDGFICEVTRCCTDGTKNACSMLYGAAARAAKAMGYQKIVTYTLPEEGGYSLRGAGWVETTRTKDNRSWATTQRPEWKNRGSREDVKQGPKIRWEKKL